MKKLLRVFIVCLIGGLLTTGCGTTGQKVEHDKVSQIKKGVTTRAEVETLLGSPTNVMIVGNGKRVMSYQYWESKAKPGMFIPYANLVVGGSNSRQQMLQIMLDEKNIVEDYEFSDRVSETSGGFFNHKTVEKKQ